MKTQQEIENEIKFLEGGLALMKEDLNLYIAAGAPKSGLNSEYWNIKMVELKILGLKWVLE